MPRRWNLGASPGVHRLRTMAGSAALTWAACTRSERSSLCRMRCSNSGWSARNSSTGWLDLATLQSRQQATRLSTRSEPIALGLTWSSSSLTLERRQ